MFWRKKKKIGRIESVDFPKLGIHGIHAKIDTGAYGSAIDCKDIEVVKSGGKRKLKFTLLDPESDMFTGKVVKTVRYRKKLVRNSFGKVEQRYIIRTPIVIGDQRFVTELSLADRGKMRYPVLIGRKALRNQFVVDVDRTYVATDRNRSGRFGKLYNGRKNNPSARGGKK